MEPFTARIQQQEIDPNQVSKAIPGDGYQWRPSATPHLGSETEGCGDHQRPPRDLCGGLRVPRQPSHPE